MSKESYLKKRIETSKKLKLLFSDIKRITGDAQLSYEELIEVFEIGYEFWKRKPERRQKYIESEGISIR